MEPWRGTEDDDAAQAALLAEGLTDGLPVVLPTPERVERMLGANGVDPFEVVTVLPPAFGEVTWEALAINAVMAGCAPEYLPVVAAAVEAMAAPEFNLLGVANTTGSACPLVIVNGPVATKIGMNARGNALGTGNRANATIGRAAGFVLRNVGGARPGVFDMATLGQPSKYTCCFAENEAQSPWPSLAVERGFAADDSTVTVVGIGGLVEVVDSMSTTGPDLAQTFAQSMLIAGTRGLNSLLGGGEPLIVMPPEIANLFAADGYTKTQTKEAIFARARLPLDLLSVAVREDMIKSGNAFPGQPLRVAHRADDLMIVVSGGVGIKALFGPTWGGGTLAVSRRVRV